MGESMCKSIMMLPVPFLSLLRTKGKKIGANHGRDIHIRNWIDGIRKGLGGEG